eukprot:gnl/Chilomastix_cuspidata/2729.p1 GENE.gnl/Chilomastix_cuspidata/2729~~gnl/Chilomastix_cuspidata/2729.p1  ORF type:complete len:479 (+),score=158.10 gnl/Chilomastix_cuspidata/2729:176-1438(+)
MCKTRKEILADETGTPLEDSEILIDTPPWPAEVLESDISCIDISSPPGSPPPRAARDSNPPPAQGPADAATPEFRTPTAARRQLTTPQTQEAVRALDSLRALRAATPERNIFAKARARKPVTPSPPPFLLEPQPVIAKGAPPFEDTLRALRKAILARLTAPDPLVERRLAKLMQDARQVYSLASRRTAAAPPPPVAASQTTLSPFVQKASLTADLAAAHLRGARVSPRRLGKRLLEARAAARRPPKEDRRAQFELYTESQLRKALRQRGARFSSRAAAVRILARAYMEEGWLPTGVSIPWHLTLSPRTAERVREDLAEVVVGSPFYHSVVTFVPIDFAELHAYVQLNARAHVSRSQLRHFLVRQGVEFFDDTPAEEENSGRGRSVRKGRIVAEHRAGSVPQVREKGQKRIDDFFGEPYVL